MPHSHLQTHFQALLRCPLFCPFLSHPPECYGDFIFPEQPSAPALGLLMGHRGLRSAGSRAPSFLLSSPLTGHPLPLSGPCSWSSQHLLLPLRGLR